MLAQSRTSHVIFECMNIQERERAFDFYQFVLHEKDQFTKQVFDDCMSQKPYLVHWLQRSLTLDDLNKLQIKKRHVKMVKECVAVLQAKDYMFLCEYFSEYMRAFEKAS